MQRVAIIGTGIAGLTAAYRLRNHCDVTIYEARDRVGGHTHTHDVKAFGQTYNIDTGFIVFNEWTYPRFQALLAELEVDARATEMSFSVRNDAENLEYNGHTFFSLFAQRRNIMRPRFHRMLLDIMRFNKLVTAAAEGTPEEETLGEFLDKHRFSDWMRTNYIVPMTAAIWSSGTAAALDFPFQLFARFFKNHGLLNIVNRPQWFTVSGGSSSYVKKICETFGDRIRVSSPVRKIRVTPDGVVVEAQGHAAQTFDHVVLASHSDQALQMIDQPTPAETEVLSAIPYSPSRVVLHHDATLLPKRPAAWAAWNYTIEPGQDAEPTVSYNMNILQGHTSPEPFVVSLNPRSPIDPAKVIAALEYTHPVYTPATVAAQARHGDISGRRGLHFCGAYWFNGFHEDGVRSGERVAEAILG